MPETALPVRIVGNRLASPIRKAAPGERPFAYRLSPDIPSV